MVHKGLLNESDVASSQAQDDTSSQTSGTSSHRQGQNSQLRRPVPSESSSEGENADED